MIRVEYYLAIPLEIEKIRQQGRVIIFSSVCLSLFLRYFYKSELPVLPKNGKLEKVTY